MLSAYDANNLHDCRQTTICNKKLCPAVEKKNASVVIKDTAYYCLHILKLNQACINIDYIKHIFESYRKGVHYALQILDTENKLTE